MGGGNQRAWRKSAPGSGHTAERQLVGLGVHTSRLIPHDLLLLDRFLFTPKLYVSLGGQWTPKTGHLDPQTAECSCSQQEGRTLSLKAFCSDGEGRVRT